MKIEYWSQSFEGKLISADLFLGSVVTRYVDQRLKSGKDKDLKDAVDFSQQVWEARQTMANFKMILLRAKNDNINLQKENAILKKRLSEGDVIDQEADKIMREEVIKRYKDEIRAEFMMENAELQKKIQELLKLV
jgi:regulator of replication initiation timing